MSGQRKRRASLSFSLAALGLALWCSATPAAAQSLGTFRWQLLPFCNVVTVAVTQIGGVYRLEGTDNQCGAATQASVIGTAFLNPNGSIGLGFTVVTTPGAAPLAVEVSISPSTLQGEWRDSGGRTGAFVPTAGPATSGVPKPAPGVQFRVQGHGTQSIPIALPAVITSWSTVLYNDGGGTWTPASGTYTVPVTGLYIVSAAVYWSSFTTTLGQSIALKRNGSEWIASVGAGSNAAQSTNGTVQHVSGVYKLVAGDAVTVTAFQGSDATRSILPTATDSSFTVTLIR
ncbi:MAG: hypothetical protein AB7Q16_21170 [Vicinamibacterales bacterium]